MQVEPDWEMALMQLNLIPAATGAPVDIHEEKEHLVKQRMIKSHVRN
jgi:hypothetical protein